MIGSLKGVVTAIGEDAALIEVNGVGYVVQAGSRTLSRLSVGEAAMLAIETHVREDAIKLYGFSSEEERGWFTHLQSVQSVGAKVALNILDTLTTGDIGDAISLQDKASFARANGVGPKLAARIVQELAGKAPPRGFLAHAPLSATAKGPVLVAGGSGARGEAVSALVNLGIDAATAARAVATAMKTLGEDPATPDLIRAALKEVRG
ncbi:MAG: Holliday junction branch migration protein RuvA [Hyphomonadaceae bacterium]|nr:Holliday junction branch migration protein RuvA [Hyphomonadaceae bacterium]